MIRTSRLSYWKSVVLALLAFSAVVPCYGVLPMEDSQGKPLPSLAPMLKTVNPAVVNIATFANQEIEEIGKVLIALSWKGPSNGGRRSRRAE